MTCALLDCLTIKWLSNPTNHNFI